jgi:hypothetical protein
MMMGKGGKYRESQKLFIIIISCGFFPADDDSAVGGVSSNS